MRESKKRLVSYIMILALMAVTVLVNDGMAKAATVTGDNAKFQKEGNTYTLTGNIVTNEEVTFDLSNGDDITIDGQGILSNQSKLFLPVLIMEREK